MKNILSILPLAFCFCFLSCERDANNFENVSLEQRTNSTKAQAVGDDIVIGTICPECEAWNKGGGDGSECLMPEDGYFSFLITLDIITALDRQEDMFRQAMELGVTFEVNGEEVETEVYHQPSGIGYSRLMFIIKLPVESICSGEDSGLIKKRFEFAMSTGNYSDKTEEEDSPTFIFCCD